MWMKKMKALGLASVLAGALMGTSAMAQGTNFENSTTVKVGNTKVCFFGVAFKHPSSTYMGYHIYNVDNVVGISISRKEPNNIVVSLKGGEGEVYGFNDAITAYDNLKKMLDSMSSCSVSLPKQLDQSIPPPKAFPSFVDKVSQIPTDKNPTPNKAVKPEDPKEKKRVF